MGDRLDEIDKRILYYLAQDARNVSAIKSSTSCAISSSTATPNFPLPCM